MKEILIKTNKIVNCWETKDACIVETINGKKWVCKKYINNCKTLNYIKTHIDQEFLILRLAEKGKREKYAQK